jgi:hypothetical protein
MLSSAGDLERRETARRYLEATEHWLRRLIHYQLSNAYGPQYFGAQLDATTPVIKPAIREQVARRRAADPTRFAQDVDATTLGEAIAIALHPRLYSEHFRLALSGAFPDGREEAQTFLSRLEAHRNQLAHGGSCSARVLEQCVCYSNDVIDSLKAFYREKNLDRIFDVPTFTRVVDNKGNDIRFSGPAKDGLHSLDFRDRGDLYPGDTLILEAEVDETFEGYTVRWMSFNGDRSTGLRWELPVELKHVGNQMIIRGEVVSREQWHKLDQGCDDRFDLRYRVLPPQQ